MRLQGIQVWDNGGKTCDRFTIRIGQQIYTMSGRPLSASGVNMFGGNFADWQAGPQDKEVGLDTVPDEVAVAIFHRAWPDAMRKIHDLAGAMEQMSQRFRIAHNTCEEMKVLTTFVSWLLACSTDAKLIATKARKEYTGVEKRESDSPVDDVEL